MSLFIIHGLPLEHFLHTMTLAYNDNNNSFPVANIQPLCLHNGDKHEIQLAAYNTYHQLAAFIKQRDQPCFVF